MIHDTDNEDFRIAYRLIEHTGCNIFLTGAAGTGKTTFLRHLSSQSSKRIVVAASTGIAAINAGGVTLHSLFQLDFGPFLPFRHMKSNNRFNREKLRLIRGIDLLVIDEVSMVRADLLDAIDHTLRRLRNPGHPFGGVQLLLIGDLQQLPPVVKDDEWGMLRQYYETPYFFSSRALNMSGYKTIELRKVYRQNDPVFLRLLNNIRIGKCDNATLQELNKRYKPSFVPDDSRQWVQLTTHNSHAQSINENRLKNMCGPERTYTATTKGKFPDNVFPADPQLRLKTGAQVMFIKNDPSGERKYYNGLLGKVTALTDTSVTVQPDNNQPPVIVKADTWENRSYQIDENTGLISESVDGTFTQIPLRTAWAMTIHKSQGLTFTNAVIDTSAAFAPGQAYVALSRCRSLDGLVLSRPLSASAFITDERITLFMSHTTARRPDTASIENLQKQYLLTLLGQLFDFGEIDKAFQEYRRTVDIAFRNLYPSLPSRYDEADKTLRQSIIQVASAFQNQYTRMLQQSSAASLAESPLQERIHAAATYFYNTLNPLAELIRETPSQHDNKQTLKRLKTSHTTLEDLLTQKLLLLDAMQTEEFNTANYIRLNARAALLAVKQTAKKQKQETINEITDPALFDSLRQWRSEEAKRQGLPAYRITSTKALINITANKPESIEQLLQTKHVGPNITRNYGAQIIEIINRHK